MRFHSLCQLYCDSLKKYSEVKLTSLPLSLATADTENLSELLENVEDTMTLSRASITEVPAKWQRNKNPDLPSTCQVP